MDIATILGVVIAIVSILGGQALEGGHIGSVLQLTAFIIVMGGTIGACCVQNPLPVVIKSITSVSLVLTNPSHDIKGTIAQILELANVSRKQGLLALEGRLKDLHDPFFKKGVQLIVDGTDPKLLQEILEIEVEQHEESGVHAAKVWEAAGGYAPTSESSVPHGAAALVGPLPLARQQLDRPHHRARRAHDRSVSEPVVGGRVGYQPEELVGHKVTDLLHPSDKRHVIEAFRSAYERPGATVGCGSGFVTPTGRWIDPRRNGDRTSSATAACGASS